MFTFGALLVAGALSLAPKSYIYCRLGGEGGLAAHALFGSNPPCPLIIDKVESFIDHVSNSFSGIGDKLSNVVGGSVVGNIGSGMAGFVYDATQRLIPITSDVFDNAPTFSSFTFFNDPGDPYLAQLADIKEDVRKWSKTKDLIAAPTFDLAQWTTDLIVRPPGDIVVWVPPNTCLLAERPRTHSQPSPETVIILPASDWTPETPYVVKPARTVVGGFQDHHHLGSRRAIHALVVFYTLVIAYVAVATLEPVRTAWRMTPIGHLGLQAVLGFVGRTLYWSMFFVTSLKGIPSDWDVQGASGAIRKAGPKPRMARAFPKDHALIGGPRPLVAYDLATYTPTAPLALRPLLVIFQDGPVPTPLALPRSATRPRTFSAMTSMEARPAPSSGPYTNVSLIEDEGPCPTTMSFCKRFLRRQHPGLNLFGLRERRVRRHAELRALRDEMGEDVALRHAQEGRKILQENLRSMWATGGQSVHL
ncbi:uncharacterized protein C8Q71DRAFT_107490 [Rhodofomes roseus]|uniref:Uncharacterized protein n=1 Tax=Rhodofomes roseus TaxID=34475 RepID=A0ABQ8KDI6_9APHY|nr:uncharacterized protein C8Q71DRAFT_107181 [Rhodofomes roseus]XP_047777610.1 uncharacterized protein C8Q71DRAFT_107490 [Rhodofomes roseus]KAH9835174.1 hypothetical protein C8Q71DRAFT_107181 [Rhodofomes roseus]KAH9835177.1 hypothetical protein C8Q71DRAFT_107490 [Rhodofomes roseus]